MGAKFGIPKNVSLKLHIYAAVAREQKEQAALQGKANWEPRLAARGTVMDKGLSPTVSVRSGDSFSV